MADNGGFSLVEILAATLVLVMVTGLVATGVPAAFNAYKAVTDKGNAQVLMSMTLSSLRDELDGAETLEASSDGKSIAYSDSLTCVNKEISNGDERTGITVTEGGTKSPLVSDTASVDLYASFDSVAVDGGDILFSGIEVRRRNGSGNALASRSSYRVESVAAKAAGQ
jgi:type II secretory pathway pseudopilin PulG